MVRKEEWIQKIRVEKTYDDANLVPLLMIIKVIKLSRPLTKDLNFKQQLQMCIKASLVLVK